MKILGKKIDFSFLDADDMKRLEREMKIASAELKKLDDIDVMSEMLETGCTIIGKCFDNIFGNGTTSKIFNGKKDFNLYVQAFKDLVKARKEQEANFGTLVEELNKEIEE